MMDYENFRKILKEDVGSIASGEFRNVLVGAFRDKHGRDKIAISVKKGKERAHIVATLDVKKFYGEYEIEEYARLLEEIRIATVTAKYIPEIDSMGRQQAQTA